jgi:PucR-like helix-turn-helix protein
MMPSATSLDPMADSIAAVVGDKIFAPRMADEAFRGAVTGFTRCAVTTIARISAGDTGIVPAARAPEFGRWLAQQGFPVGVVRDSYWLTMRQLVERWADLRWRGPGVPVDQVTRFSQAAFDFTERGVEYAERAHKATNLALPELDLDAVLLHDLGAAKAFALGQLGELAADTARAQRGRDALFAWLSTGSQKVAAARLGLHLNSVRLRLNAAAETLGPQYLERRTELLVALRICRRLGASALRE